MSINEAAGLVAAAGRGADSELAHFTPDELEFFDYLQGGRNVNPATGLPEYGMLGNILKGLVRAGATIAGGMMGGPMGAAAASAAATKLTGGSWKEAGLSGALSGVGSFATSALTGAGTSLTAGFGSQAASKGLEQGIENELGRKAFLDQLGSETVGNQAISQAASSYVPQEVVKQGIGQQFMNAATSAPGIAAAMGSLSQPLEHYPDAAPPGLSGPKPFTVRPMNRRQIPYQGDMNRYGEGPMHKFYDPINPGPDFTDYNGRIVEEDMVPGFAHGGHGGLAGPTSAALRAAFAEGYKRGGRPAEGKISGPGGGTDDLIPARLSNNEHVVTSREISALGGGDPDEGHRRMYGIRRKILKKAGYKNTNPKAMPKGNLKIGIGR